MYFIFPHMVGLTIYKYTLQGNGDIVADYVEGRKKFNHKDLVWK